MVFTKNELEVMTVLWSSDTDLTRNEIIDVSPQRTWKSSTIHTLLNGLMSKDAVKVVGMKPSGKIYGRTYAADITQESYLASQINSALPHSEDVSMTGLFAALVKDKPMTRETLHDLRQLLDDLEAEMVSS